MNPAYKTLLKKQGYEFIGEHSASKICMWTKASLKDKNVCYKQKFYGIQSHRCAQISVAINFCQLDCSFCWRERNNSEFGKIDDPAEIVQNSIKAQRKLLSGFGGLEITNKKKFEESKEPLHFAISLNGENLTYPRIGDLIKEIKKYGGSSFVVTNGQLPEVIEKMEMPTQLYVSLSAPNEILFKKIDRPLLKDGWQRLMKSMGLLKMLKHKTRTVIRLTLIKNENMTLHEKYGEIIRMANPTYLEVKAFALMGASKQRYTKENTPTHEETKRFAIEVGKYCGYKLIDEQPVSRVVLMMEEDRKDRIMNHELLPRFKMTSSHNRFPA